MGIYVCALSASIRVEFELGMDPSQLVTGGAVSKAHHVASQR